MSTLSAHLATGLTTVCRCWAVSRRDGIVFGFTDHDEPLVFDEITFRADTGMSAKALVQGTGLSVDNTEALGILSDAAISEMEIDQGRFDGAEVRSWLVNWANVEERLLQFRGHMGEIRRGAGAFHAELRGLTDALNQPRGRVFQRTCSAVLGDAECKVDLSDELFSIELLAEQVSEGLIFQFSNLSQFVDRWFDRGRLLVVTGAAEGLEEIVKQDRLRDGVREVRLWSPLRGDVTAGDTVRLIAGCDKRPDTCRVKFANYANFRGFPHIPGEDWLVSVPRGQGEDDGGSLGT